VARRTGGVANGASTAVTAYVGDMNALASLLHDPDPAARAVAVDLCLERGWQLPALEIDVPWWLARSRSWSGSRSRSWSWSGSRSGSGSWSSIS